MLPFDYGTPRSGWGWRTIVDFAETAAPVFLALAIVILAGPQKLGEPKSEREMTNIEFCVDVSGSMGFPFGGETRYDVSMRAIDEFLAARKGDAFGLTFFANNVIEWVPLTNDPSALRCAPPFMKPEMVPPWMGGTMIGKALREAKKTLAERQEGDRMIILVSDGESFDLSDGQDEAVARELKAENIAVYHIHVSDESPPESMGVITTLTGGEMFSAGDPDGLKSIFKRIDAMRQAKLRKKVAETLDDFFPWAIASLSTLRRHGTGVVRLEIYAMVAEVSALAAAIVMLLAEWIHARRVRRLATLAFGPRGRPAAVGDSRRSASRRRNGCIGLGARYAPYNSSQISRGRVHSRQSTP